MIEELDNYKSSGHFFFSSGDDLSKVCNAPKKGVGVYHIYALKDGRVEPVFIGSSGSILQTGKLKIAKGGMFNDIVNGEQFGAKRFESWKKKLIEDKIEALDIYWYETVDEFNFDIPKFIEGLLFQYFLETYGKLPKWNLEY